MNDFMKQRHSQFEAPEEVVFDLIHRAVGQNPSEKRKVVAGLDSEVYDVEVYGGKHYILKIKRFGDVNYQEEAWAMDESRKQGIPVPRVLLLDTATIDGQPRDIMVQERADGVDFGKIIDGGRLTKADVDKVLKQAGSILRKINSIHVRGFWRPHGNNRWDFKDWDSYIDSSIKDRVKDKQHVLDVGFSENDFDFMMEIHRMLKQKYPCKQPLLCHGDFTPDHWFVDKNLNITSVIDFGDIQGGPDTTDLAVFSFNEPELGLKSLLKGYFREQKPSYDFEEKLNLHKLVMQMGYLVHYVKGKNEEEIKNNIPLLRQTLENLKRKYG